MVDLVLGLVVSALAAGSSPEAGAPLAPTSYQRVGGNGRQPLHLRSLLVVSAPLCGAARQVWPKERRRFLVGVMMWSCRSYEQKLYPIGVSVSNDGVDWALFPSIEAFVVMLSARSMVF
ncbi:hypothetical protein SETIT_1G174500v2 [Setaria italica]|uniref:Secreted protein n=1 Tax=Setaria italica TaxID=4555 RepID=A0A368PLP2_SETIT|nr:hypothetical protein SETIT_1G174500v2 [Setaria italica]